MYGPSTGTPMYSASFLVQSSIWARDWLVKLVDITKLRWPVVQTGLS